MPLVGKESAMKLKQASDIMTHPVITVRPDIHLTDAIKLLLRHHISGLPVVGADGRLVGIITEHDIMNLTLSGSAEDTTVEETMTREVITFPPDADLATLAACLAGKRIRRVPIIEKGALIGIVSRRDILREVLSLYA